MLQRRWARLNDMSAFNNLRRSHQIMLNDQKSTLFSYLPMFIFKYSTSLNHNITKWLTGFLWPWICPPNKSNQLLAESPWMFVPNVRKFPGGVFELLCSQEWNRHMDDRTRQNRYAPSNDNWWHKARQHPDCVHHWKKENLRCFYIFLFFYLLKQSSIHWMNLAMEDRWSRSTGVFNAAIQTNHEVMKNSKRKFFCGCSVFPPLWSKFVVHSKTFFSGMRKKVLKLLK